MPCEYNPIDAKAIIGKEPEASIQGSSPGASDTRCSDLPESQERRILELRLLHHFSSSTCKTLPGTNVHQVYEAWAVSAPLLALENNTLLYTILAISALHLAHLRPEASAYIDAYRRYFFLALPAHNQQVSTLSSGNADAICLTCLLINFLVFRSTDDTLQLATSLPQRLMISRGSGDVFYQAWNWISQSTNSVVAVIIKESPQYLQRLEGYLNMDGRLAYKVDVSQGLDDLLNPNLPMKGSFDIPDEPWDAEIERAYTETLGYICWISEGVRSDESQLTACRRLMGFLIFLPTRFIALVQGNQPRAQVMLAHFFALANGMEGIWWIRDTARREVLATYDTIPPYWRSFMQWPLTRIGETRES